MKIPEYKACAATVTRAEHKPEWAKEEEVEALLGAARRRHELPGAQAQANPALH